MIKIRLDKLNQRRFKGINKKLIGLCTESIWLAGGSIRSIVNGEYPNDYDFFFKSSKDVVDLEFELDLLGYSKVFECPVGSLKTYKLENIKVQLITPRFYSSIEELISSFDFTVTCGGVDNEYLYIHNRFSRHVINKYLSINKLTFPAATINRLIKYKNYGYYTADAIKQIVDDIYSRSPNIVNLQFLYMD